MPKWSLEYVVKSESFGNCAARFKRLTSVLRERSLDDNTRERVSHMAELRLKSVGKKRVFTLSPDVQLHGSPKEVTYGPRDFCNDYFYCILKELAQ